MSTRIPSFCLPSCCLPLLTALLAGLVAAGPVVAAAGDRAPRKFFSGLVRDG
jgi:hypothetical protein